MIDGKLESKERHPNDLQVNIESSGAMALLHGQLQDG